VEAGRRRHPRGPESRATRRWSIRRKKDVKKDDKPGNAEQPGDYPGVRQQDHHQRRRTPRPGMAQQLVRLMTQTTAGEGDFGGQSASRTPWPPRRPSCSTRRSTSRRRPPSRRAARRLRRRLIQPLRRRQRPAATNPTPNRIRVVADPTHQFAAGAGQAVGHVDHAGSWPRPSTTTTRNKRPARRPTSSPFKYARADDVYDFWAKVYKDQIDQNPGLQDLQNLRGFTAAIAGSKNNNPRRQRPAAAGHAESRVDEQSNSLVVKWHRRPVSRKSSS